MIGELQKRLGYSFKDEALLRLALTHPSVVNMKNNQRLEFLGDSILGAIVAGIIYEQFPEEKEGELARRHAALVRGETLTRVAREIALGDVLEIGTSEVQAQGRQNASNLEDALEAVIGALYLDGGMLAAEQFIKPIWTNLSKLIEAPPKDSKTTLQEWAQGRGLPVPIYQLKETTGPAHAPEFTVEVTVQGHEPKQAKANSKRHAEQIAASLLLESVRHE